MLPNDGTGEVQPDTSSGYLLMESYLRKPKTAVQYTLDKLKRTYLSYFIALCFCFVIRGLFLNWAHHTLSMDLIFGFIREMLLFQSVGLYINGGFNPPTWYFCVLIWGGALLYYLISKYTELSTHLLIPILCIAVLTFLCNQENSLESWDIYCGVIYIPFIRGIAEMGLGTLLCTFAHSRYNKMQNSKLLDFFSVVSVLFLFYLFCTNENYDKYVFLFFPLIVFAGMSNKSFLNTFFLHKICYKLGGVTYEMYLIHFLLGVVFHKAIQWIGFDWNIYLFFVYAVLVTLTAFAFKLVCQKIYNMKLLR